MRFGILPFIRLLFSDECRVFSAGTRQSTFVEGGVFPPFCQCILSLNACVFCRYTIMHYIVSVYMQVADCTIGFLLYLDTYHLP